jgi:hypothetical protein
VLLADGDFYGAFEAGRDVHPAIIR